MALTVHQTFEISRLQFLDKELTCPLLGHTGASWCFTGASLGQGCRARCVHDKCPDPDRRAVQKTVEDPQLQFSFKVVIIPVGAQRQFPMVSLSADHGDSLVAVHLTCSRGDDSRTPLVFDADVEKTVEIPQLQRRCWTPLLTCLSLRNDRCRGWS